MIARVEYFEKRLCKKVQGILEPDETAEQAFVVGLGHRTRKGSYSTFRIVAVTDRSIVVLSRNNLTKPTGIVQRFPRATRIGPVSGMMECTVTTLGEPLHVLRKDYDVVREIDAAAGFPPD
jgi:hypothetical protein